MICLSSYREFNIVIDQYGAHEPQNVAVVKAAVTALSLRCFSTVSFGEKLCHN
jgi:hypothetical protein